MADFFKKPILNSPYEYPARHWELDKSGQPVNKILDKRRGAEFITPIPKTKKRKKSKDQQDEIVFDGRWAFAEFTDVYEIEADFKGKVEQKFNEIVDAATAGTPVMAANNGNHE
jgi:type III restriction enzyme